MSATGITLLAAPTSANGPPRFGSDGGFLLPGLYMAGALLLGAVIIAWASRWRRKPRTGSAGASEQLAEFRSLYEKGEMSREEFERVRTLLGEQIRHPASTSPPPAAIPPASTPATVNPPSPPPEDNGKPTDDTPPA